MSGKRDKKRQQRRRADQRRHADARREQQRRSDDVIRSFVTVLKELEALAVDQTKAPEQFAQELGKAISGDDTVAHLLRDPHDSWMRAEEFAAEAGSERALAIADALSSGSTETSAAPWWACGFLCGADHDRRAEELAAATLEALGPDGHTKDAKYLLAELRLHLERPADAMELARSLVEADPSDAHASSLAACDGRS